MKNSDYLIQYVKESPKSYLIVAICVTIVGMLEFVGITSLLPAVSILLGEDEPNLPKRILVLIEDLGPKIVILIYLCAVIIQTSLTYFSEVYFLKKMGDWRTNLSLDYVKNLLNANFYDIRKLMPGEAEIIITRNVGFAVRNRHKTALFISDSIIAFFYSTIALFISPQAFILFFLLGLIYGLINRKFLSLRVGYAKKSSQGYLNAAKMLSEYINDFRGLQTANKKLLSKLMKHKLSFAGSNQVSNDVINVGIKSASQPVMLLLLIVGVAMSKIIFLINNGEILIMLYLFYRAAPKLISIARGYGEIIQDSPVDLTPEIILWKNRSRKLIKAINISKKKNEVFLKKVSFTHNKKPLLDKIDMKINAGELVVLMGKSGSGKSTLLDLICGYITPHQGKISLLGIDPASIKFENLLLPDVSLLRTESIVISGTLISNIAFLEENPDSSRVLELLNKVGLQEIISSDGLYTVIESKGANLSAGQRQRLLIARALYKSPKLLILDEPTSNLDAVTEKDINKLLVSLKRKIIVIIVSHRKELIQNADSVYKLENQKLNLVS